MQDFIQAIQFLTRIPTPKTPQLQEINSARHVPWYSVVGLVIAVVLTISGWMLHRFGVPPMVNAVLLVALWAAITGGLHLDGVADCADAWMSGRQGSDMLEIMQDSHCGAGAVIWVVLLLAIKIASVGVIIEYGPGGPGLGLLFAPVIARLALQIAIVRYPYISAGMGENLQNIGRDIKLHTLFIGSGLLVILALVSFSALLFSVIFAAFAFALVLVSLVKRSGGFSGDVYGALVEITESLVLVGVTIIVVS